MANLYRKSSLEKLSNPEQLDKMIKISSPISWLALIAVLLIIAVTVVWSVLGTLPTTETVSGMIVDSGNVSAVYSDAAGILAGYSKTVGSEVNAGEEIASIRLSDGSTKTVTAGMSGVLSVQSLESGMPVLAGSEVARITPKAYGSQVVVCYVPLVYAQRFKEGMKVLVNPASIDSQKYGHMEAAIVSVEEFATNTDSLAYVLGSGNLVAEQFAAEGPVVSVVCALTPDSSTKSGFFWSGANGKNLTVSNGMVVSAQIVVDESAPITRLIGNLNNNAEGGS